MKHSRTSTSLVLITVASIFLLSPRVICAANGPLRVSTQNPRYLTDNSGKAIFIGGSNYWYALQDGGNTNPPPAFDFNAFVSFLDQHSLNYTKAHVWEQFRHTSNGTWNIQPTIYARTGPGTASDGGLKFDLSQYNAAYFDRLAARVNTYSQHGIYVAINIFDKFSVCDGNTMTNVWAGNPYNPMNNVSNTGLPANTSDGLATETLAYPEVTALQEAYVRHLVDTLNSYDNVIWEVLMEGDGNYSSNGSTTLDFVNHFVDYIHTYEATKPKQHPILFSSFWPGGDNNTLFQSGPNVAIIAPNGGGGFDHDCPSLTGTKVVLVDTDHIDWTETNGAAWAWKCFTRGAGGFAIMDGGYSDYDDQGGGAGYAETENFRYNLGWIRHYADKMNLIAMTPQGNLSSTAYALARNSSPNAEFLVFQPFMGSFTVNLSAISGSLSLEWYNPADYSITSGGIVEGGAQRTLTPPFSGMAVAYLSQSGAPTETGGGGGGCFIACAGFGSPVTP